MLKKFILRVLRILGTLNDLFVMEIVLTSLDNAVFHETCSSGGDSVNRTERYFLRKLLQVLRMFVCGTVHSAMLNDSKSAPFNTLFNV